MTAFRLWSDDFKDGDFLDKEQEFDQAGFGGSGANRSPVLHWEGVPAGCKSLALTVYDPDAPTGSGFWHWVAVNLPATLGGLAKDAGNQNGVGMPAGALQMVNDYGQTGFGGWAPPKGDKAHRYIFSLHALSVDALPLNVQATNAVARFMVCANTLEVASIMGYYEIK